MQWDDSEAGMLDSSLVAQNIGTLIPEKDIIAHWGAVMMVLPLTQ